MWMWDDMCFYYGREVVLPRMPREIVLVDWHYGRIGDRPNFSFRNWEEIDCTRELIEAGFTVVPASALDPDNIATFVRYVQGLGCDTFLATNWEGTHRFPDSILPALAQAGNLLQSGNRAPWKVAGQRLLPNRSETERRDFLLAIQGEAPDPEPALEVLRRQPDCPTHQATRCALLQRFVKRELSDILDESDMAARQALRRGSDATAALAPVSRRLEKALESGREWLSLLDDLSKFYEESESDRGIYHQARHMVADLERRQGGIASFCKSPGRDTFFGDPVELALDIVIVDPCAHACRIEVGDRADRLQIVHKANCLPLGSDGTGRLTVPLKKQPKFIRISINGYARVGLATALIRTLESDGILPRRIIATGGLVIDAEHLLTWDRKAALFNEPDIPSKWLANDVDSDNFVLLEY